MSDALFTSKATAVGGRDGRVKSDDGIIDLTLVNPSPNNKKKEQIPSSCLQQDILLVLTAL